MKDTTEIWTSVSHEEGARLPDQIRAKLASAEECANKLQAILDTVEPVLWPVADESARGESAKNVLSSMAYSKIYHTDKPNTSNPIWVLYCKSEQS